MSISIPTRNHSTYINEIINFSKNNFINNSGLLIDYTVLDSSDGYETERLFSNDDLPEWHYVRLPVETTADRKCFYAIRNFQSEYIWIIGDGVIIDFPNIINWLSKIIINNYDYIHLINADGKNEIKYCNRFSFQDGMIYTDVVKLFHDFFWTSTFMGSIILSRQAANEICKVKNIDQYMDSGFALSCAMYEAMYENKSTCYVHFMHYYYINPMKRESSWITNGEIFEIWTRQMPRAVEHMPDAFTNEKEYVISTLCNNNGILSLGGFIKYRSKYLYNIHVLKQYRKDIERTSDVPYFLLELIAHLPKWVCQSIFELYNTCMKNQL